jgi:hypothetical protein
MDIFLNFQRLSTSSSNRSASHTNQKWERSTFPPGALHDLRNDFEQLPYNFLYALVEFLHEKINVHSLLSLTYRQVLQLFMCKQAINGIKRIFCAGAPPVFVQATTRLERAARARSRHNRRKDHFEGTTTELLLFLSMLA